MKKALSILAALMIFLCIFSSCSSNEKSIIGKWTSQESFLGVVTETVYQFNEDGTGTMSTKLGVGIAMNYTISDNSLTITSNVLGLENTKVYTFTIEGNTLTLIDGDNTTVLTKSE